MSFNGMFGGSSFGQTSLTTGGFYIDDYGRRCTRRHSKPESMHGFGSFGSFGAFGAADPLVSQAQTFLNMLGAKDERGMTLTVDGIWGNHVNAAFANLYKMIGRPQPTSISQGLIDELRVMVQQVYTPGVPPPPGLKKAPGVPGGPGEAAPPKTDGTSGAPPSPGVPGKTDPLMIAAGVLGVLALVAAFRA